MNLASWLITCCSTLAGCCYCEALAPKACLKKCLTALSQQNLALDAVIVFFK